MKRKILIIAVAVAAALAIILILAIVHLSGSEESSGSYEDVKVSKVKMEQTITAAGEVAPSETEHIEFSTSRKFKGMCVEEDQTVVKGQHLILYSDGTYTDATENGIITKINAPDTGDYADDGNYVALGYTDTLSLNITITESDINNISKGDTATIVVNSDTSKEFNGEIVSHKSISDSLLSEKEAEVDEDDSDSATDSDSAASSSGNSSSGSSGGASAASSGSNNSGFGGGFSDGFSTTGTSYYTVSIDFTNDGTILTGMSAICTITISSRSNVLSVPVEAVQFDDDDQAYVNVVDGGDLVKQEVTTGQSDADNVEIEKGLGEGTTVRVYKEGQDD